MSLAEYNGLSAADIAAVTGNNGNSGGFGWNDGSFWMLILFFFLFSGGGWGNRGGFMSGESEVQRGFDQQSVMNGLTGLSNAVSNGFSNAEISRCNAQANILQTLNANQAASNAAMNSLAMSLQNCCCENRAAVADVKYLIANDGAATRAAGQANTQTIMDKLCQLEMDGIKQNYENRIATLQTAYNQALAENQALRFDASQNAKTATIMADNAAQTLALEQYLNPSPIPAYVVQNPNCCSPNYSACSCGA